MRPREDQATRDEATAALLDAGAEIKAAGNNPLEVLDRAMENFERGAYLVAGLSAEYERQKAARRLRGEEVR